LHRAGRACRLLLLFLAPFLALEVVWRAGRYDAPRGWRLRALVVSLAVFGVSLGTWGGAAIGILVYELVHYWYHRAAHRWNWLWRLGHQVHHRAESMDAFGAYYLHPLDAVLFMTWALLVFFPLLGLSPEAGAIASACLAFNAAFQHANIRTPRWLGDLVQRPESHAVHHGRGIHRYNYSDLPLWDMVFGTFRNPGARETPVSAGFYRGGSARLAAMLAFREP
jgi:sterol desaturase/sphingolipid hydroxylase (fatty acid hydroxylase superfamily)